MLKPVSLGTSSKLGCPHKHTGDQWLYLKHSLGETKNSVGGKIPCWDFSHEALL